MPYQVTIKKPNGSLVKFDAPTLPETKTVLLSETIQTDKHYYYSLTNGDDVEYRTSDASQPSIFAGVTTPPGPIPDTIAPSTPTNLNVSLSGTIANLVWGASTDNIALSGYEVYQGSTLKATVTTLSATITGLVEGQSYTFTVKAIDTSGNKSVASNAVTINVPAVPVVPPVTSILYASTSFWNKKLSSTEPIHSQSAAFVQSILTNKSLTPAANINIYNDGKPIYVVDASIPKVMVKLIGQYSSGSPQDIELNKGVRIPVGAKASGGTDHHICILDTVDNREIDLHGAKFNAALNRWEATDAGILYNYSTSNGIMVDHRSDVNYYWNSATATHLPLAGGVIRVKPSDGTLITPTQRLAVALWGYTARNIPVPPALSSDGAATGTNFPPEGTTFRFPANIPIDINWTPITKILVNAIRDYGMIVVDKTGNAATWFIEDPTQYGYTTYSKPTWADWSIPDILIPYLGGKMEYKIFGDVNNTGEFPWGQLQALQSSI